MAPLGGEPRMPGIEAEFALETPEVLGGLAAEAVNLVPLAGKPRRPMRRNLQCITATAGKRLL